MRCAPRTNDVDFNGRSQETPNEAPIPIPHPLPKPSRRSRVWCRLAASHAMRVPRRADWNLTRSRQHRQVMSYFADLTLHTYTPTNRFSVLNVGWLDAAFTFPQGQTDSTFRESLRALCEHPILLHRGFHVCQFCSPAVSKQQSPKIGNGQIRVKGKDDVWYAAPTMVHHYVSVHQYQPPAAFVDAVLNPVAVWREPDH